jgi:hypothetical protein
VPFHSKDDEEYQLVVVLMMTSQRRVSRSSSGLLDVLVALETGLLFLGFLELAYSQYGICNSHFS